ncbi:MAG: hypothetical protein RIQ56_794 [Candidatus Parcubacteria bacterium]|jgi:uncharacterized membrane protein (UPF0127 family)
MMKVVIIFLVLLGAGVFWYGIPDTPNEIEAEFGGVSLRLEIVDTPEELRRGLGGRMNVPEDYGMLLVFPEPSRYGFWMKDTLVPLDIFWIGDKGHVVSMAINVATSTYPNVFYPAVPARYVLETRAGFARAQNIATGTPLILQNWPTVSH